jgi:hypothetical protein
MNCRKVTVAGHNNVAVPRYNRQLVVFLGMPWSRLTGRRIFGLSLRDIGVKRRRDLESASGR